MKDQKGYVNPKYLEAAAKKILPIKKQSYTYMQIKPDDFVLDVGCGSGVDTLLLAELVGRSGKVVGVDHDRNMIREANKRTEEHGISKWVSHQYAKAYVLPFESNTFNSTRSERLFEHLTIPEKALNEMIRVTKPGGWIVVADTDWGTLSVDTTEPKIARKLWDTMPEEYLNNGYSGRQLFHMFKHLQLEDIKIEPHVYHTTDYGFARWMAKMDDLEKIAINKGSISQEDLNKLLVGFKKADEEGCFFATLEGVIVAGRKP